MKAARWALLVWMVAGRASLAHDLWIVPGKHWVTPGEKVRVFVNSSDRFPESTSLLGWNRIENLSLHSAAGTTSFSELRADGKSLTFELTAPGSGSAVLALAVKPRRVRLRADDFNDYLKAEAFEEMLALREDRGEIEQATFERYAKYAKACLQSGSGEDDVWSRGVGLTLEIVPLENPLVLRPGDTFDARVLFRGEPLAGVRVVSGHAEHGGAPPAPAGRTDAEGRVALVIPAPGRWYLRALHLIRRDEDSETPWESFWSTLTFEVRP